MKRRLIIAAPLFIALTACSPIEDARPASAPVAPAVLDVSLLDEFDRIATRLKAEDALTQGEWQAYADAIGSNNIGARALERSYTLAFSSQRAEDAANATGFQRRMIDHLRAQHDGLDSLRAQLSAAAFDTFAAEALARARAFLPSGLDADEPPRIRVVPFGLDAYGEPGGVFIDPGLATRLPADQLHGLVAHEYHHVLAYRMAPPPSLPEGSPDAALYGALRQLQREGIADMIDKGDVPITPPIPLMQPVADRFNAAFANAPARLAEVSQQLADYPVDDPERADAARKFRGGFALGGHPLGYYMARTIEAALGRDALIATLPDPLAFIDAYQRAAAVTPDTPALSAGAIETVKRIGARRTNGN